jgi:hypothetical protein
MLFHQTMHMPALVCLQQARIKCDEMRFSCGTSASPAKWFEGPSGVVFLCTQQCPQQH